jgi:hypothetical protein
MHKVRTLDRVGTAKQQHICCPFFGQRHEVVIICIVIALRKHVMLFIFFHLKCIVICGVWLLLHILFFNAQAFDRMYNAMQQHMLSVR